MVQRNLSLDIIVIFSLGLTWSVGLPLNLLLQVSLKTQTASQNLHIAHIA